MMATKKKPYEEFEKEDRETILRTGAEWTRRVNLDIPTWALKELDREADRRGITRQALIKMWLIDRIDALKTLPAG